MKLPAFFLPLSLALVLSSCTAFSKDDLNQSSLKKFYDPPVIKISPNPSNPIIDVRADISFDIEQPGGLGAISYKSDGGLKTYNASSATTYSIKDTISSLSSRTFPMTVTAYSAKTGISTTTNVEFLLFAGTVSDPPLITISEPTVGRLLTPGAITIRGSALHPAANIQSLTTERVGFAPVSHPVPTPNPNRYDFTQTETIAAGDTLDMTITAISSAGISSTTNITWQVVDIPDIVSITPPVSGTVITTTITNFGVVVNSPHTNTPVNLYWNGVLKGTGTTDGSGTPLVFSNITIPLLSSAASVTNIVLRIEASFPGGRTAAMDYVFSVDHTLALTPPAIVTLFPDPAVPLLSNSLPFQGVIEQNTLGLKRMTLTRTSPSSTWATNFPISPIVTSYTHSENIPMSAYSGIDSYSMTTESHAGVAITSNFTYTLVGPTNTIRPIAPDQSNQAFEFESSDPNFNIQYVLISTNTGGTSGWQNYAAFAPNASISLQPLTISLPYNRNMGVRMASVNANGIITTNSLVNTFVAHSAPYVSTTSPPPGSNVPIAGGFPFSARVLSSTPITQVELKVNGNIVIYLTGITPSTTYNFATDISSHLVSGANLLELTVNGVNVINGAPIQYTGIPQSNQIMVSYPQDRTVQSAGTSTIRIQVRSWGGGARVLAGTSTIEKLSTGEIKSINGVINPGGTWQQSAADAFDLDIGENRFKIRLDQAGPLSRDDEIVIYRLNGTNY